MSDVKPAQPADAIALLKADHREVDALFTQFERASGDSARVEIVSRICQALSTHATIEEKVFYPAAREVLGKDDQDLVDEAQVEHGSLKDLMKKLRGGNASSPQFEALVTVLKEYVQHHVKEEESEFFPKVQQRGLDGAAVGAQLQSLKARLAKRTSPAAHGRVSFVSAPSRARSTTRRTTGAARTSTSTASAASRN